MDFELVQWLNFTIRAQDYGTPPRFAELPVYLRIVDVNDNNPVFVQPSYQVLNRNFTEADLFKNESVLGGYCLNLRSVVFLRAYIEHFCLSLQEKCR